MTTATTILALLPILTSDGRGSDIMIPMAHTKFVVGMLIALITLFVVPVLILESRSSTKKEHQNETYENRLFFFFIFFILKGNAQQLETLIDEALANNPEIQKIDLQYKRVSEKVNEVNAIPNTEFVLAIL